MHVTRFVLALAPFFAPAASSQTWQFGPTLPTNGQPRTHARAVQQGNDVFILAGTPFPAPDQGATHRLSMSSGTYLAQPEVLEEALYWVGVALDGLGRVIVFGGENTSGVTGDSYEWNPIDGNAGGINERSSAAPNARFGVATNTSGLVYSIGGGPGASASASTPNATRVERYDAQQDAWSVLPALPEGRADAATCFDGTGALLVIGGYDTLGVPTASVLAFDEHTNTWSTSSHPPLPTAIAGAQAVRGADDRVYVIGGTNGVSAQVTTFVLDRHAMQWTQGPDLQVPREHFAALLASDDFVWVFGGENGQGSTNTVERLFTPRCAQFASPPRSHAVYTGSTLGLSVGVAGASPFTFQWRKDGLPLSDGLTPWGSTIVGANSDQLGVQRVTILDAGNYDCIATNGCGSNTSPPAVVTLIAEPPEPTSFQVRTLHPAGALSSHGRAVEGDRVGGSAVFTHPTYNQLGHPYIWTTNGAGQDITPASSVGGEVRSMAADTIAGWYWWPYTTPRGTGYYAQACIWTGTNMQHQRIQRSGWDIGSVQDTDGQHHVGGLRQSETSLYGVAAYWPVSNTGPRSLTTTSGSANAVDGDRQFGSISTSATMWEGMAGTATDLHPSGFLRSAILGAGSGQQVGTASGTSSSVAGLWDGSRGSFTSLQPSSATSSTAQDTEGGYQVGAQQTPNGLHATLWRGSAVTAFDLHAYAPASFTWTSAYAIDVRADGSLAIAGEGMNGATARVEALVWISDPIDLVQSPTQVSLATGGQVTFDLQAGATHAGQTYLVLGTVSGTSPGFPLNPMTTLPLNLDAYTVFLLANSNGWIHPSLGTLDGNGSASAVMNVPPFAYAGAPIDVWHAYLLLSPTTLSFTYASQARRMTFFP